MAEAPRGDDQLIYYDAGYKNTIYKEHVCAAGYTGSLCDMDIDECDASPCENGATCINDNGSFTCMCAAGYTGCLCDMDIDECDTSPCENGATYINNNGSFTYMCAAGYTGSLCDMDIDECENSPCENGQEPEVFVPFLLAPTIIQQGREDYDPSYTMSVDNELTIEEHRLFMEWQEQKWS